MAKGKMKKRMVGAGILAGVVILILALLPKFGGFLGEDGGGSDDADKEETKEPAKSEGEPLGGCDFRIVALDQILGGSNDPSKQPRPLRFEEFLTRARECRDGDHPVHIYFTPNAETAGFRKELLDTMQREGIPHRVHEPKEAPE